MESCRKKAGNYLSIDGGLTAACGLCALYILNEMFERLQWDLKSEMMPLPCELFEMIIGSGFGGLIALLLGPLRLSPSQAIDAYEKLIPALSVTPAKDDEERKRNTEAFEIAFSEVLVDAGLPVDAPMIDKEVCKTILCTLRTTSSATPYFLRTYRSRGNAPPDCTILQAALASVASVDKFLPVTLGETYRRIDLIDAVTGYANPTQLLLREAQNVFDEPAKIATVVSIGLGKLQVSAPPSGTQVLVSTERLKQVVANCEQVHRELQGRLNSTGVYFRFSLDLELNAEDSILSSTLTYLEDGETNKRMNEATKSIQYRPETISLKDINSATTVSFELKPRPSLVRNFVGREDILEAMRQTHVENRSPDPGLPAVTVLMGLGGSGKTQTALRFALDYEKEYRDASVYFFYASSEAKLKVDFQLAIHARDSASRSKSHDDALVWFANRSDPWLIIIDNADDPSVDLFRYIPKSSRGNVIITTRNSTHKKLAPTSSHHVEALSPVDASTLILKGSSYLDNDENRAYSQLIGKELGYLPLALAHAAAYISDHQCLPTYIDIYRERRARFLATKPTLSEDYNLSVGTTIQMCLDSISPPARDTMALLSQLDVALIAQSIISTAAEQQFRHIDGRSEDEVLHPQTIEHADALMAIFCPSEKWLESDFNNIIQQCLHYSLLQVTAQGKARFYSMHVLVQAYLQSISTTIGEKRPEQLVVRLLGSSITIDFYHKHQAFNRLLVPHLRLVAAHHVVEAGDHYGFGHVLREQGGARLAIEHSERCLALRRSSLGDENTGTLDAMHQLAICYDDVGRHQEAFDLKVKVLDQRKQVLDDNHPDTLSAMNNLAMSYSHQGRYQEALELQVKVMDLAKRVSGDLHLDTLIAMGNVASSYSHLGRYQEALELQVKVMDLRRRVLGDEHPGTLRAMGGIALYYSHLGRYQEALELQVKVMDLRRRVLGDEHPETLRAMDDLATYYSHLGRHQEALELQVNVVDLQRRISSDERPETLRAMANLAVSYGYLKMHTEALEIEEKVLEMRAEYLGGEHRDTLLSMFNLAVTLGNLRMKERAITLLQAVLPLEAKVLGIGHAQTIKTKEGLEFLLNIL